MAAALCVRAAVFKGGESNGHDPKPGRATRGQGEAWRKLCGSLPGMVSYNTLP